jgi:biopolymer transport protein ExbD
MIVRPLELASRLRPEPRNFDWLFYVNAGLLALFFSVWGSRFVLAPGLQIESMAGARASATPTTHYVSVSGSGMIFANQGPVTLEGLKKWLGDEARVTKNPALLVIAARGILVDTQAGIVSAATSAGFRVVWAFEETATGGEPGRSK